MARGFQLLTPEKMKEVASQGGRAAHASGNAREFNSEQARAAARKMHEKRKAKLAVWPFAAEKVHDYD